MFKYSLLSLAVFAASAQAQVTADTQALTIDESMSLLATQYPGFAGFYVDGDQTVVKLADATARAKGTRISELLAVIGEAQKSKRLTTANANYGFDELYRWHFDVIDLMSDSRFNVHTVDIDEVGNVIALTLDMRSSKDQIAALNASIAASGVPADAVAVRFAPVPTPHIGLRDRVNPAPGGVQIEWTKNSAPAGQNSFVCSLGLNVRRGTEIGFITAQHCQDANGEVFTQAGVRIGASVAVGPTVSTGCPSGQTCKYSDALFARYDTRNFAARQQIAYAPNLNNIQGNLTVISALSTPAVGSGVWKTGRTTGSTQATVEATCQRLKYSSYPITFLCLNKVNTLGATFSQGGDSGGPVWINAGNGNVSFTGLISGGGEARIGNTTLFGHSYYSPFSSIQKDLGTLTIAY